MRKLIFLLGLCFGIIGTSTQAQESKMKLFILAGQSNMAGEAEGKMLSSEWQTEQKAQIFADGKWVPLKPGKYFGPEISFASEITKAFPNDKILILKVARGATSLAEDWAPSNTQEKALYPKLIEQFKAVTKEKALEVCAMLWMQGESDARYPEMGKKYLENFKNFIGKVREDVKDPSLLFIFGRINPPATRPALEIVLQAQDEVSKTVARTLMVSTDGLEKQKDNLHYNANGQIELGKRFAKAYLDSLPK